MTCKDLIVNGIARIVGKIYSAGGFVGNLTGNCSGSSGSCTGTAENAKTVNNLTVQTAVPANAVFTDTKEANSLTCTSAKYGGSSNTTNLQTALSNLAGALPSSIPTASSTTPKAPGTATVGTETNFARGDHVHPVQTTVNTSNSSRQLGFISAASVNVPGTILGYTVTSSSSTTINIAQASGGDLSTTISWGTSGNYWTVKSSGCNIIFIAAGKVCYVAKNVVLTTEMISRATASIIILCAVI